jgi:TonB family protein
MKVIRLTIFVLCSLLTLSIAAAADRPPIAITKTRPIYPFDLFQKKTPGFAIAEFVVQMDGSVKDLRIVEATHRDFETSVITCVYRWKFKPAMKSGKPVPAAIRIRFDFDPKDKAASQSQETTDPNDRGSS